MASIIIIGMMMITHRQSISEAALSHFHFTNGTLGVQKYNRTQNEPLTKLTRELRVLCQPGSCLPDRVI